MIKRKIVLVSALISFVFAGLAAAPAQAKSGRAAGPGGAVGGLSTLQPTGAVQTGLPCYVADGFTNFVVTYDSIQFLSHGRGFIGCKKSGVTPPPSGQVAFFTYANTGLLCTSLTGNYPTRNWVDVVTPSGTSVLTCIFT